MDYLSNLKEIRSVIESVFRDHLCFHGSNMKYTKLGEQIESQESLNDNLRNDLINDMLQEERLNCDLGSLQVITLYSDSDDSFESESSVTSDKGSNSTQDSTDDICKNKDYHGVTNNKGANSFQNSTDELSMINESASEESSGEDLPTRLVITYHFSFDTDDDDDDNDDKPVSEEEDIFENCSESSFCSENEMDMLEYSSVKNGSKNNLLDCDFEQNLCNGNENVGLVDYESDCESDNSAPAPSEESVDSEAADLDTSDNEEKVSSFCGNPSTPSMRHGFIYYSSEIRLYQGELRYDDTYPEKKFNLARKIFRKMFPSQKYVVNA